MASDPRASHTGSRLLARTTAREWIGQFAIADQADAIALLDAMLTVSAVEFVRRLRSLIKQRGDSAPGPVAVYAERELQKRRGIPNPLFKQSRTKVKRAYGAGPPPVRSTRAYDPAVGSEGLVAQIISEVCRENRRRFFNHPGPDAIRKHRVRRIVVVSDFT